MILSTERSSCDSVPVSCGARGTAGAASRVASLRNKGVDSSTWGASGVLMLAMSIGVTRCVER